MKHTRLVHSIIIFCALAGVFRLMQAYIRAPRTVNVPMESVEQPPMPQPKQEAPASVEIPPAPPEPAPWAKASDIPVPPPLPPAPNLEDPTNPEEVKKFKVKTREWGEKFKALEEVYGQVSGDRENLKQLREKFIKRYLEERTKEHPDFAQIMRDISKDTIDYINQIIEETMKKVGPAPTKYCFFTLGSLARQESGFFTDLEIGVFVEEKTKDAIDYFARLSQLLSDRFFLLGEHPDVGGKGLRMDEADNAPLHHKFFARYASKEQAMKILREALEKRDLSKLPFEGSRLFIATPKEYALHSAPESIKKSEMFEDETLRDVRDELMKKELRAALQDPHNQGRDPKEVTREVRSFVSDLLKPLSAREVRISESIRTLSRNIAFLYGDKVLLDQYLTIREQYLAGPSEQVHSIYKTRRQEIAYLEMKTDIVKHMLKTNSIIATGELGKEVDIKRELYRFPEQILTDLGFWYNVGTQNTLEIIEKLRALNLFNDQGAAAVEDLMNYVMGLRLKQQEHMRKQLYALPITQEEHQDQLEKLQRELTHVEGAQKFLIEISAPQKDLDELHEKIAELQAKIQDLSKMQPQTISAILSPQEIERLNNKYLPILRWLFESAASFLAGNPKAFATNPPQGPEEQVEEEESIVE